MGSRCGFFVVLGFLTGFTWFFWLLPFIRPFRGGLGQFALFGGLELGEKFFGILLEILHAAFAAELHGHTFVLVDEGTAHAFEILIGHQAGLEGVITFGGGAMFARAVVLFTVTVVVVVVMIVGFTATTEEQAAGNEGHWDELEQGLHFHNLSLAKEMKERQKYNKLRGGCASRPFPLLFHRCYGSTHA